jgi:hypothetical protein
MQIVEGSHVAPAIDELIEGAQQSLILICPYFQPWNHLSTMLRSKLARGVPLFLLVRGGDDGAKQAEAALPFISLGARVYFLDRLHAKIYVNEHRAILTSMNLVQASKESWDVATAFDAAADAQHYQQIVATTRKLFDISTVPSAGVPWRREEGPALPASSRRLITRADSGFCIRCGATVPADPEKPFCRDCYASWAEWENAEYKERCCHLCGRPSTTSMAKPLCRGCWSAQG